MIDAGLTPESMRAFLRDLDVLALPREKKKEILVRSLQMLKRQTVSHAANQREPSGAGWKPRKNGTAKMLRRIAKLFNTQANSNQGQLYYKNNKTGQIALEHQEGLEHEFKKTDFKNRNDIGKGTDPATLRQAKKLRDLGYSIAAGKRRRRLSIHEIQQQLTRDRAGVIIRKMTNVGNGKGLTKWIIPTVKRPFLDERAAENAKLVSEVLEKYLQENRL